jgi:hypothetical protein
MRHWRHSGFGVWSVEEPESGELPGNVGLTLLDDRTAEPTDTEAGRMLARPSRGRAFAIEAGWARIACAVAFPAHALAVRVPVPTGEVVPIRHGCTPED